MDRDRHIKSVSFKTLGCKLNQSETDAIMAKFQENQYITRPFGEEVDLTIINTCTVTNDADSKSRATIRRAIRNSPRGRVVVTGCYAQVKPEDIQSIDGVDLILGNDEKYHIFDHLNKLDQGKLEKPLTIVNDEGDFATVSEDGFISATSRTRAFLKIQEGCDYYCSYCIIPFARGKARSRPFQQTIEEARKLVDQGYREIVLTGINIGTYYNDDGKRNLVDLLAALETISGLDRVRVSSIEPNTVTDDLLHLVADSNVICDHLHIPLQSANDDQLSAMNRKYQLDDYARLMERFGSILPDAALGTDVIVGFPGETEAHFKKTVDFIQQQPFTYLHIFRYSPREGTVAAKLENPVPFHEIKRRSAVLHEVGQKLKSGYADNFSGQTLNVLFDQFRDGVASGYTRNYLRVQVPVTHDISQSILPVILGKSDRGNFSGTLAREAAAEVG
ncbi:MAG: tRNA (N(6)-L-threonylcarbamoyladenosine(37)-C(2))-methylthiotransferase MtaB [Candidatus Marinimicrobia bacterium]|nr:tRNA (N(6)-L-threonylcarbamoyladenosine(37)-C(2))-methylthiotransferase MtaB [Candidatus Neomarinimicrobiota bacterium]MCF7840915.1 tRNA (N(6)-L-threonylcarbamoyladenosine(37)-C(2))-methylthiotransferase MtaB [Candidatus Neomarinimicrobiota bacterium]MCF7903427.1 tRNA (N(6)-L-threonylcarbamoyladenosine(37)-C(2))-methylthiotransferase MtaB [Candidatus Neomarinimicrobiota bacterium]